MPSRTSKHIFKLYNTHTHTCKLYSIHTHTSHIHSSYACQHIYFYFICIFCSTMRSTCWLFVFVFFIRFSFTTICCCYFCCLCVFWCLPVAYLFHLSVCSFSGSISDHFQCVCVYVCASCNFMAMFLLLAVLILTPKMTFSSAWVATTMGIVVFLSQVDPKRRHVCTPTNYKVMCVNTYINTYTYVYTLIHTHILNYLHMHILVCMSKRHKSIFLLHLHKAMKLL